MKFVFAFIALILIFVSCTKKKETIYSYVIQNTSGNDISMKIINDSSSFITFSNDSIVIPKGEEYVVFTRTSDYKTEFFNPCKVYIDSITSTVSGDSLDFVKPIADSSKWVFKETKKGKKGKGECECRFTIVPADLVP